MGQVSIHGTRLTVEVNSEAQADRFADLVGAALGEGARFRVTQVASTDAMLSQARAQAESGKFKRSPEAMELNNRPEVRAKLAELRAAHF